MSRFNQLTDETEELLAFLVEELGEAVHMVGKVSRHGLDSSHPDYQMVPNRENLQKEIGDIVACVDLLIRAGHLDGKAIHEAKKTKLGRLLQFAHHRENKELIRKELAEWSA